MRKLIWITGATLCALAAAAAAQETPDPHNAIATVLSSV